MFEYTLLRLPCETIVGDNRIHNFSYLLVKVKEKSKEKLPNQLNITNSKTNLL